MYLFSLPSPSPTRTIPEQKKMDSTYSSQGFDDTYSRIPRSRAGSGVSTTEGLLQSLQLAETTSFETRSYTSSRPTSSRGLASPAYLSPSLSHSPGYLTTPLSQHQQPFPRLSSEAIVSDAEWFEAENSRVQGAPLLRLEPAHDQPRAAPSPPPLASVETDAMRYSPRLAAPGSISPLRSPLTLQQHCRRFVRSDVHDGHPIIFYLARYIRRPGVLVRPFVVIRC
jgi:hypothetical protein